MLNFGTPCFGLDPDHRETPGGSLRSDEGSRRRYRELGAGAELSHFVRDGAFLKGRNERSTMRSVVGWRMEVLLDVGNNVADRGYGVSEQLGGAAKADRPLLDGVSLGYVDPWHRRSRQGLAGQGRARNRHR